MDKYCGEKHHLWKGGGEDYWRGQARKILLNTNVERRCGICDANEYKMKDNRTNLMVHHLDGNIKNNTLENLRFVCRGCHMHTVHQICLFVNTSKRKYKDRQCINCGKDYTPLGAVQKFCELCGKINTKKVAREYAKDYHKRKRGEKNEKYDKYDNELRKSLLQKLARN